MKSLRTFASPSLEALLAHLLREAAVPPPGGRARAAEPELYLGVETHEQLVYVVVDSW